MARQQGTAVSRHLPWVLLQGGLFLPGVAGTVVGAAADGARWDRWAIPVFLTLWLGYCLARNLVLMWRAPASETRSWHLVPLFAIGLLLALVAAGPLLDGGGGVADDRPKGAAVLLVASSVLALGVREVLRLRRAGGARTHDPRIMSPLL